MPPGAVAGQVTRQMISGGLELVPLHPKSRHQPHPEVELGIVGRDLAVAGGVCVQGFRGHSQAQLHESLNPTTVKASIVKAKFNRIDTPFRYQIKRAITIMWHAT